MKATIRFYNTKGKEHENLVQTQRSIWNKEVTSKNPGVVCVYIYLLRTPWCCLCVYILVTYVYIFIPLGELHEKEKQKAPCISIN